jgi:CyaY protein
MFVFVMDEQQFRLRADEALGDAWNALARAADEHGFETDLGDTLTVEFDDPPAKFVVSPNAPVRQIWISAHSKSYKLAWEPGREQFVLPEDGRNLKEILGEAVSQQLGSSIQL